jgi:hypothetical protein
MAILVSTLCGVGAAASFFVVLVRIPPIASTKLDLLLGTLQGTAVGLLFAIVGLLINLTYLVCRTNQMLCLSSVGDGSDHAERLDPRE